MKVHWLLILFIFVLSLKNTICQAQERTQDYHVNGMGYFQTDDVYPYEKGESAVTVYARINQGRDENEAFIP